MRFIKLTTLAGEPIVVNTLNITTINRSRDSTIISFNGASDNYIEVKESLDEILAKCIDTQPLYKLDKIFDTYLKQEYGVI